MTVNLLKTLFITASVVFAGPFGCPRSEPGGGSGADPAGDGKPLAVTGDCHNENLSGICRFVIAAEVPDQRADAPAGTKLYRVEHEIEVQGDGRKIVLTSAYLRIPDGSLDQLVAHYEKNSPTPCKAYIVRPPCNPDATSLSLGVGPPEFAKPERY